MTQAVITEVSGSISPGLTHANPKTSYQYDDTRQITGTPSASIPGNTYTKTFENDYKPFGGFGAGLSDITTAVLPSLTSLTSSLGAFSSTFDAGTNAYTAIVPYSVDSITVTPALDAQTPSGAVTVNRVANGNGVASALISPNVGSNTISVIVSATGTAGMLSNTYTLAVTREAETVSTPAANPAGGTYASAQSVTPQVRRQARLFTTRWTGATRQPMPQS